MQRGPLDSLVRHRDSLTVFVDNAAVPMDNNAAERGLRGIAVGRKLSFGSVDGARLASILYSIFGTLEMNGISPYPWLSAYLASCARHGSSPPEGPAPDRPAPGSDLRTSRRHPTCRCRAVPNANEGRLWNEFVARYLGHSTLTGAQMRHFVRTAVGETLAVRGLEDRAAGQVRGMEPRRDPPLVVNNARFLISPWVRIKNLAVLTLVERWLPDD